MLHKWNPRHIDDLFVLLQLPMGRLSYITKKIVLESNNISQGNRVYYFTDNFEVWIIFIIVNFFFSYFFIHKILQLLLMIFI